MDIVKQEEMYQPLDNIMLDMLPGDSKDGIVQGKSRRWEKKAKGKKQNANKHENKYVKKNKLSNVPLRRSTRKVANKVSQSFLEKITSTDKKGFKTARKVFTRRRKTAEKYGLR